MVAQLRTVSTWLRCVSIGCLGLALSSCQKADTGQASMTRSATPSAVPMLGAKERCLSAPHGWWSFRTPIGTGNADVWNPQGPYRLCLSVSGRDFRQHWEFSSASRVVQAFPHIDLPWKLPLRWTQTRGKPITLSWQNRCTGSCRDDLGFDFWLSASMHPVPFRAGDGMEVMVLPDYRAFQPPSSSYLGVLNISGSGWSVYRFPVGNGWPLLQVIGPAGSSQASLNPLSILRALAQDGWIPQEDHFVTVADLGTEIVSGSGSGSVMILK